jgi:hypothetical protein
VLRRQSGKGNPLVAWSGNGPMKKRKNVLMKVREGLEMAAKYDVVVVGLGAMGSAAAYEFKPLDADQG